MKLNIHPFGISLDLLEITANGLRQKCENGSAMEVEKAVAFIKIVQKEHPDLYLEINKRV
jgi:hypothetical protein